MTLRPCYRATCDAPDCAVVAMLPHDRTTACRLELAALGWVMVTHHVRPGTPGAPRFSYLCPRHRGERPPGWRSARGPAIRRQAQARLGREAARRGAAYWMLAEALGSVTAVARAVGLSPQYVGRIVLDYEAMLQRRQRSAAGWQEPWAQRLRAAGAIR
jgi:hypothetical protein